jgi:uncharacterized SAM-binding protein YcdF (DUF218 family)
MTAIVARPIFGWISLLLTFLLFLFIFCISPFSFSSVVLQKEAEHLPPLQVYVIPGGGSGQDLSGYPEWTSRRALAAYQSYLSQPISSRDSILFLALSAGSLNSPNRRSSDDRIIFECQKTIEHLQSLGVPKSQIFGDFLSWDTVTNALALRLFLEGSLEELPPSQQRVSVNVFISDFHATRVRLAFEWVLDLAPSLLDTPQAKISLVIHEVSSVGLFDEATLQERLRHETEGAERIKTNQVKIQTMRSLHRFIFIGGHEGLWRYLHGEYTGGGTMVGY